MSGGMEFCVLAAECLKVRDVTVWDRVLVSGDWRWISALWASGPGCLWDLSALPAATAIWTTWFKAGWAKYGVSKFWLQFHFIPLSV